MNKLKEMNGNEIWTNAFGERFYERVCVFVKFPFCFYSGKKFKPTKQEVNELWEDMITQEFGSKQQLMNELELEFENKR